MPSRRQLLSRTAAAGAAVALGPTLAPLMAEATDSEKRRWFKIGICEWMLGKKARKCFDVAKRDRRRRRAAQHGQPRQRHAPAQARRPAGLSRCRQAHGARGFFDRNRGDEQHPAQERRTRRAVAVRLGRRGEGARGEGDPAGVFRQRRPAQRQAWHRSRRRAAQAGRPQGGEGGRDSWHRELAERRGAHGHHRPRRLPRRPGVLRPGQLPPARLRHLPRDPMAGQKRTSASSTRRITASSSAAARSISTRSAARWTTSASVAGSRSKARRRWG